jgi:hypothetical protein
MENVVDLGKIEISELLSFFVRSGFLLAVSGLILYLLLVAAYPPVHDALHDFRHSLAIIPCH